MWVLPSSSSHFHIRVPMETHIVLVPPNPLMTLFELLRGPSKSFLSSEMRPEHLLSTPIGEHFESVSNVDTFWYRLCRFSFRSTVSAMWQTIAAMAANLTKLILLLGFGGCAVALANQRLFLTLMHASVWSFGFSRTL